MANSFLFLSHANRREKVSKSDCVWPSPTSRFFHEPGGGSTCRDKRGAGRNERVDNRAEHEEQRGIALWRLFAEAGRQRRLEAVGERETGGGRGGVARAFEKKGEGEKSVSGWKICWNRRVIPTHPSYLPFPLSLHPPLSIPLLFLARSFLSFSLPFIRFWLFLLLPLLHFFFDHREVYSSIRIRSIILTK